MKLKLLVIAMATFAFVACAQNEKKSAIDDADETTTEQADETKAAPKADGEVIVLEDDSRVRPGMKVDKLTVLDFNATWCPPCKQFAPAFHDAAKRYTDVDFISIDTDVNPETAGAFEIQGIPTVIFLHPDGKVERYVGTGELLPAENFNKLVEAAK